MSIMQCFAETGALSQVLNGYIPRQQQQQMAQRVADTIAQDGVLVSEAGTGVGKTFAYLAPAILSGKRVIIATGTKNLQDQLFHEDFPVVRKALTVPVTVALLKGRGNYLCRHRLATSVNAGNQNRRQQHELQLINDWAGRTVSGDIAEVDDVEESAFVWSLVTSTTENCIGQNCDDFDDCHVLQARRKAQTADIVVINHHLLFADMALKEQGFGEILPGADVFVIDEAHQLPEVAGHFFGFGVTSRQLYNLVADAQTEHLKESGALSELPNALNKLEKAVADLRLCMGDADQRLSWEQLLQRRDFQRFFNETKEHLLSLSTWLSRAAERGKGLDNCHKRALDLLQNIDALDTADSDDMLDNVRWADTTRRGFRLHSTPLNVAEIFQANMQAMQASWIFTSATLAVGGDFTHFNNSLGLENPDTQLLGSPFDYKNNALNYIPDTLPYPAHASYTHELCAHSLRAIKAAQGRTFMLFTSHRALKIAAEFMDEHIDYPLLVQGKAPKQRLLKDFKAHGNAVLLGTASFWEGVDVRGSALSCVIIDKLPFASPTDPIIRARLQAMEKRGQNPFLDYQLPNAVVALKQGVGRLIRDVKDIGVLILCDPRLVSKSYGKIFLQSLPEMPLTRKIEDVERFFASRESI